MSVSDALRKASALHQSGRLAEAEAAYRQILAAEPVNAGALHFFGVLCAQKGALPEAAQLIGKAVSINPGVALAHFHLGGVQAALGRMPEALAAFSRALALEPNFVPALDARSEVLRELGQLLQSLADCARSLALAPGNAAAHDSRGCTLTAMGRLPEALEAFNRALQLDPALARAFCNRSLALRNLDRIEEALADADKGLALDPSLGHVAGERFYLAARLCDWRGYDAARADLARRLRAGQRLDPWHVLVALDDPALQLQAAKSLAPPAQRDGKKARAGEHERLRIAYLSSDFRDHPVAYLMVELLERHNRARFETFGICLQASPASTIRTRIGHAFEHFVEMGRHSDNEVAQMLEQAEIDIAIDLAGHTGNGRTGIFRRHPAPLTVSYIGYPGTMGCNYMDYILADALVIQPGAEAFFSEKVVRLPHCFLPADTAAPGEMPTRAQAGLPEKGFVFCCFNNSYKLTPQMFDIWMRLLLGVEDSLLWLQAANDGLRRNLRHEAEARGVAADRLIFADRLPQHDAHLARVGLADLFLDTLPYNAHTTAGDALGAGVPLITCMGQSFAARVAGSMLSAIGMNELIAGDLEEYESLALDLARDPERLASIRGRLAQNRATTPLFDMAALCRHIEAAYEAMWKRHLEGQPPMDISLPA